MKKKIILKADDFWAGDSGLEFPYFLVMCSIRNIKVSLGVVGASFEEPQQLMLAILTGLQQQNVELFNHSYRHMVNAETNEKEFFKTTREYQKDSIDKTQKVIKDSWGVTMRTIGFPANACDDTTIELLSENPDITHIYHVPGSYNLEKVQAIPGKKVVLVNGHGKLEVTEDGKTPRVDFDVFKEHFENTTDETIVYQLHPSDWTSKDFYEFQRAIGHMIKNDAQFIFPTEL